MTGYQHSWGVQWGPVVQGSLGSVRVQCFALVFLPVLITSSFSSSSPSRYCCCCMAVTTALWQRSGTGTGPALASLLDFGEPGVRVSVFLDHL